MRGLFELTCVLSRSHSGNFSVPITAENYEVIKASVQEAGIRGSGRVGCRTAGPEAVDASRCPT